MTAWTVILAVALAWALIVALALVVIWAAGRRRCTRGRHDWVSGRCVRCGMALA